MAQDKDDKELKLGEVFRKVMTTGIGAAFMTEDAVKNLIADLPLPKDILNGLLQNAKASKDEFIRGAKEEVKGFLGKVDLKQEIQNVLENYDIEVNAKFHFTKKEKKESAE